MQGDVAFRDLTILDLNSINESAALINENIWQNAQIDCYDVHGLFWNITKYSESIFSYQCSQSCVSKGAWYIKISFWLQILN